MTTPKEESWEKRFEDKFSDNLFYSDDESAVLDVEAFITHVREEAKEAEKRRTIEDLKEILSEEGMDDEWRVTEIDALISLRKRELTPTTHNEDFLQAKDTNA